MNTMPIASKYRISPNEPLARQPVSRPNLAIADPPEDGFGALRFGEAATAPAQAEQPQGFSSAGDERESSLIAEVEAIRAEGLTGRQLRNARRIAQRYGIDAASDIEAVRLLRRRGIDPFQRSAILELVNSRVAEETGTSPEKPQPAVGKAEQPKKGDDLSEERRLQEVMRIQRDIASRRRRKIALLFTRLAIFVFAPTFVAGWYYFRVATPLFVTKSEFVIQQAESGGGGLGGLFSGTQFATSQDSITVQSYLQSRDAMLRLEADIGFKEQFTGIHIDPIQRLAPDASNEAAYKKYKRNVTIGYDPTEGIIRMEVAAPDPQVSASFSRALIGYAEERIDQLTQRLREDQMRGARESYDDAERKMLAAQQEVLDLQEKLGVLDPQSETGVVMSQVASYEAQLQDKRLQLDQLLDNPSPNQARVDGVKGDIERLENVIAQLREQLTTGSTKGGSLAAMTGQLRIAEAALQVRQLMLGQAAQQLESARIEANKQVRYLSLGVSPVAPDEASYPRAIENTALAFVIFAGIYLIMSLTASVLREQVSA